MMKPPTTEAALLALRERAATARVAAPKVGNIPIKPLWPRLWLSFRRVTAEDFEVMILKPPCELSNRGLLEFCIIFVCMVFLRADVYCPATVYIIAWKRGGCEGLGNTVSRLKDCLS